MKGTFLLTVHVELAWGFIERVRIEKWCLRAAEKVRDIMGPLLKLVRDYEIPVTWAVLGHLFLDHCKCDRCPHPDMPRPNYSWFKGDWYKFDPCSNVRDAPVWYGKDIVQKLFDFAEDNLVEQEIGCHSFSHQMFGDPGCSEELARAEIDKCLALMKIYGISPKTFAFPLGSVGYTNLLKEKGFAAFCSDIPNIVKPPSLERSPQNVFRKYASLGIELMNYYLLQPPPVAVPKQVLPGLWDVPNSMCFNKKRNVSMDLVVLKAKKGIERAVRERKCFHMFTHLHNFGVDSISVLRSFEDVLSYADKKRKKGKLQIATVRKLVEIMEN